MKAKLKIAEYRSKAGLTQEELSDLTGIPLSTLRRWEQTGGNIQNAHRLVPIADVLGCSIDDLIGRAQQKENEHSPSYVENRRESIAAGIALAIDQSGLTIAEFAEQFGVSTSTASNWISGKEAPKVEKISEICKAYNVSLVEMLGPKCSSGKDNLSNEERALIEQYRALEPREQGKVIGYIAALLHDGFENSEVSKVS